MLILESGDMIDEAQVTLWEAKRRIAHLSDGLEVKLSDGDWEAIKKLGATPQQVLEAIQARASVGNRISVPTVMPIRR